MLIKNKNIICCHCGVEFIARNKKQYDCRKIRPTYCSDICRTAGQFKKLQETNLKNGRKPRKGVLVGPCPICNKMYQSKIDKKFCSMKCYGSSPEALSRLKIIAEKGNRSSEKKWEEEMKMTCICCKKEYRANRRNRKFCSQICTRKYRADLFDAWIANPEEIVLPQCYDEFMMKDQLPCLIDSCKWEGSHLGIHLQMAHGIRANDFKRAAGFNLSTGLVNKDLHKELSERKKQGVAANNELREKIPKNKENYKKNTYHSLEGKESAIKARALSIATEKGPINICRGCCKSYQQSTIFGRSLFCTIECREKFYADERIKKSKEKIRVILNCRYCNTEFIQNQYFKVEYYCSTKCRSKYYRSKNKINCLQTTEGSSQ